MLKYGIFNQYGTKEALPLVLKHNTGIMNMSPIRLNIPNPDRLEALITSWKQTGFIPQDSLPDKDPLGWLVHDDVDSVVSAGYKFAADHLAISTVVIGTINMEHLEKNVAALEKPYLPEADKKRLIELFSETEEWA